MRRVRFCFLLILLFVVVFNYCHSANNEIIINPVKVCEFAIGNNEFKDIPNVHEYADIGSAPQNIFIDNDENIYVFIFYRNRLIKVSPAGKIINNYDLSKYGNIFAMNIDRLTNTIYALKYDEILVFNIKLDMIKLISLRDHFSDDIIFTKIKTFNRHIYIYESQYNDLYRIYENKNKTTLILENYFLINNIWLYKISNSPSFGSKKFIYLDKNNNKREFTIDDNIPYLEFMDITDLYAYLFAFERYQGNYIIKILIFNRSMTIKIIQVLQDDDIIHNFGPVLPLICIDSKGNMFQLCLMNNKFLLYKYDLKDL